MPNHAAHRNAVRCYQGQAGYGKTEEEEETGAEDDEATVTEVFFEPGVVGMRFL